MVMVKASLPSARRPIALFGFVATVAQGAAVGVLFAFASARAVQSAHSGTTNRVSLVESSQTLISANQGMTAEKQHTASV